MSFKNDIPNYQSLDSCNYSYMSVLPRNAWEKLEALAALTGKSSDLKKVVNQLNELALIPPTKNWGHDFLIDDLSDVINELKQKEKFSIYMDALEILAECGLEVEKINTVLEDINIGYKLLSDGFGNFYWEVKDSIGNTSFKIEETTKEIQAVSQQALEFLIQTQRNLNENTDERSRKEAVRNCLSAMENLIKHYAKDNDIKNASKILRDQKKWGNDFIVKDGYNIFDRMHEFYPDLRHGSLQNSSMSLNEAKYWIDRILAYINFLVKQANDLNIK